MSDECQSLECSSESCDGITSGILSYQITDNAVGNDEVNYDCNGNNINVPSNSFFRKTKEEANEVADEFAQSQCPDVAPTIIILKDDEVTSVLNNLCENIRTIGSNLFFCSWDVGNLIAKSTDGLNWSSLFSPAVTPYDISYGNGMYVVACGNSGSNQIVYTSTDLATWTQRTIASVGIRNLLSVAFGNGIFVAVGEFGIVFYSSDGITWTPVSPIDSGELYRVRFVNGKFYALGLDTGHVYSSSDGITWDNLGTFLINPGDISYGNGIYVIACHDHVYTSSDGVTWVDNSFSGINGGLAFGSGKFCLVRANKTIWTSDDGVTWVSSNRIALSSINAVTFLSPNTFVCAEG